MSYKYRVVLKELAEAKARIKALEGEVEEAYREGYRRGYGWGHEDGFESIEPRASYLEDGAWSESKISKKLEEV